MSATPTQALVYAAAQLVCAQGLELAAARRAALRDARAPSARTQPPTLAAIAHEVQTQLALYHPQQPAQLHALRMLALQWLERLAPFSPLLRGNVWLGLATQDSALAIDLYADSPKTVEIFLINHGVAYALDETPLAGGRGRGKDQAQDYPALCCPSWLPALQRQVPVHLTCHDADALRSALKMGHDAPLGLPPRGNLAALQAMMHETNNKTS